MRTHCRRLVAALSLTLPLAACPPGIAVLPKAGPEEVRLLDPDLGQVPEPGYIHIGPIDAAAPAGVPLDELLLALRSEGARKGADAVVLQRIRTDTLATAPSAPAAEVLVAEGLAIFWPPR